MSAPRVMVLRYSSLRPSFSLMVLCRNLAKNPGVSLDTICDISSVRLSVEFPSKEMDFSSNSAGGTGGCVRAARGRRNARKRVSGARVRDLGRGDGKRRSAKDTRDAVVRVAMIKKPSLVAGLKR